MPAHKTKSPYDLRSNDPLSNEDDTILPPHRSSPAHNRFGRLSDESDDDTTDHQPASSSSFLHLASSLDDMNAKFDSVLRVLSEQNTTLSHHSLILGNCDPRLLSKNLSSIPPVDPNTLHTNAATPAPTTTIPVHHAVHASLPVPLTTPFFGSNTTAHVLPPIQTQPSVPPVPAPMKHAAPLAPAPYASSTVPPTTSSTIFGQNSFSLLITGASKIKYMSMETHLKSKVLENDSVIELEKLYSSILMAISFVFETDISFVPSFQMLTRDIDFETVFLTNLVGTTHSKCFSIFTRLGSILKGCLISSTCISSVRSPKAAIVVRANPLLSGWNLLEKLLRSRLVICGGVPDYDLDVVRTNLTFQPNESFTDFYIRTQNILNEYQLTYSDPRFIPTIKLTNKFLTELNRASEYIPFLTAYHNDIIHHIRTHGDIDNSYTLPFTIHEIYDMLIRIDAPPVPATLRQSKTNIPLPKKSYLPNPHDPADVSSFIACLEVTIDEECYQPTICAKFASNKQRCQACLLGFHRELDCYLRGPTFQPPELKRRLKIYNQVHGDAPPPSHKLREYKPQGKEAIHDKTHPSKSALLNPTKTTSFKTPFSNFNTKTKGQLRPTVNALEVSDPENEPTMSSFIQSQSTFESNLLDTTEKFEDVEPVICSSITSTPHAARVRHRPCFNLSNLTPFAATVPNILSTTPQGLVDAITKQHEYRSLRPCKKFLKFHSASIESLPSHQFTPYGDICFHVDGGANCHGVNDMRLFYFYFQVPSNIEHVGGDQIITNGWGGILVKINNLPHLLAPVYYCPNNPRNTLSTTCLVQYTGSSTAIVNTNKFLQFTNTRGVEHVIPFMVQNDLDHVYFTILAYTGQPTSNMTSLLQYSDTHKDAPVSNVIALSEISKPRRSPRLVIQSTAIKTPPIAQKQSLAITPPSDDTSTSTIVSPVPGPHLQNDEIAPANIQHHIRSKQPFKDFASLKIDNKTVGTIDRATMSTIAAYFVHLHPTSSPRDNAIRNMNSIMGNHYRSLETPPLPTQLPDTDNILIPVMAKFSRSIHKSYTPLQEWQHMHLGMMHASPSTMQIMIDKNLLADIPPSLHRLKNPHCMCYICSLSKSNRLPRGKPVDKSNLAPFQRLHVDFSFFGVTSIRGFTSALDITCASTSYTIGFPTRSKTPPLEIMKWLINTLRSMGHNVTFIRVDEDGSLANSTEFCRLLMTMNCLLETTGGGNSTNNGIVEVGNRTKANMIRSQLSTMNLLFGHTLPEDTPITKFWCFAYQMACFILRRLYNRSKKDIPYFLVHGKRPSMLENVPLGSIMTVVNPNKHLKTKLDPTRAIRGYFLGYSNHCLIRLYWDPNNPNRIKRSTHSIIEDTATLNVLQQAFSTDSDDTDAAKCPPLFDRSLLKEKDFDYTNDPFPDKDRIQISITLPPSPTSIGVFLTDDTTFNMPYIKKCVHSSPIYNALPNGRHNNLLILSINGDSPITASFVKDELLKIQKSATRLLTMTLIHRGSNPVSSDLATTRAMFDQVPNLLQTRPVIASKHNIDPDHTHFVHTPSKPDKPKSIFAAMKTPHHRNWKAAAWQQFQKNHNIAVFSIPFPSSKLPSDARVFRSQLVPEVKDTDVPGIFEFKVRDVIVGTPQIKNIDYQDSYSPSADATTIRVQLAISASRGYIIAVIDVKNAFQNTIASPEQRIYVTIPPWYLDWATHTLGIKIDPNEKYFRQMLNSNQGTRDAGALWYALLKGILEKYGFIRCAVDHGFFVKELLTKEFIYLSIATDDLLTSCPNYLVFDDLVAYLRQYFDLSVQAGNVLKFLGLRIIQSNECISVDQGEYTFGLLQHFWGQDVDKIKTISSPMRYDSEFEKDMFHALPLTEKELEQACITYKGGYRFWTGKFVFLSSQTRTDICYATRRLSEYNNFPTIVMFEAIVRVLRYLAGDILRPVVYPREPLSGSTNVNWYATPDSKFEITVPNNPCVFADAELARCLATRRTYFCIIITIFNVFVTMKIKKTNTIMHHTTDAEMKASYDGLRQLMPIRQLFSFCGLPLAEPSKMFTDNAAVSAIIDSERMTPRCRHLDIPIAFLQQEKDKSYHMNLCRTLVMLADMGTKPHSPQYVKLFKYWSTGARYLPTPGSDHYNLLQMQYYERNYVDVLRMIKDET